MGPVCHVSCEGTVPRDHNFMARREMAAKINERGELRDIFGGFLRQVRINTSLVGSALLYRVWVAKEGLSQVTQQLRRLTARGRDGGEGREERASIFFLALSTNSKWGTSTNHSLTHAPEQRGNGATTSLAACTGWPFSL